MKAKAFTLIEVMVVLSVLAIIAILAYNFFGSTMKEASRSQVITRTFKDITSLTRAYEFHLMDGRAEFSGTHQLNGSDFYSLVANGYLRELPKADGNLEWASLPDYRFTNGVNLGGVSAAVDTGFMLYFSTSSRADTDAICEVYNKRHSGLGETSPTAVQLNQSTYCRNLGSGNSYLVGLIVDIYKGN